MDESIYKEPSTLHWVGGSFFSYYIISAYHTDKKTEYKIYKW